MANFHKIIEHLSSFSNEEMLRKGKAFEHYCKWFLENDPRYTAQIKQVWFWDNWPGNWGRDKGIDLIAQTHDGKIWAIQAKAYDENISSISKSDIDSFLSESSRKPIDFRLLIATTNNIGSNAREVMDGQEKPISLCLLDNLEASPLDWSACLNDAATPLKKERFSPRHHQEKALTDIIAGFEQSPRGQLHMACGTGKTLVGLWLAERLNSNTTLVLVPSISLVAQLYREWSKSNSEQFPFYPLFVCSDITVNRKNDDDDAYIVHSSDIGFPVTTNAQDIVETLSRVSQPTVIFATYHSSPVIKEACELDPSLIFDLVIADEAHRCAGSTKSDFATVTHQDAIRRKRTLFMTATPRFFTDRVKKIAQESEHEMVSMDDHERFGPVFHTLLFSDAIKADLLTDYQVIISIIDNKTYQEYAEKGRFVAIDDHETDARTLASQIMVAKAITKYDLTRLISFHSRNKSAREFVDSFPKALSLIHEAERPIIHFKDTIDGDMPQADRSKILKRFKQPAQEGAALLANVRCLSEGVDVPTLDGIIFIDPKGSETDIIQAVGRAIRKAEDKHVGTILIPIFVDDVNDEAVALEQSCFKTVWHVIKALRAHDNILAEELDSIRLELGKRTYKSPPKLTKIIFDIPVGIDVGFGEAITPKIIQQCSYLSLAREYPELAKEWHPTKNGDFKPEHVTVGSNNKVWWKCSKGDDHEWKTQVNSRRKQGCGVCANQVVVLSNCLATTHPHLAQEWHPTKNGSLNAYDVTSGSRKQAWWKCPKGDDHEWVASIYSRRKNGCGVCANQVVVLSNCLATTHPDLAREWHPTKNGSLTPYNVTAGSNKKIWWKCPKGDDHEWHATCYRRSSIKSGCPICSNYIVVLSNCLATTHPDLAREWHPTKNGSLTPYHVVAGSDHKAWWKCPKGDDHEWITTIYARTQYACSICTNRIAVNSNCLAITHPGLAREWHPTQNGSLTPYNVTAGSHKKAWWKCFKGDDHEWIAVIKDRKKYGCGICTGQTVVTSNCLATTHPHLTKEWHPTKNGSLTPYNVTAGSNKKAWWLCSNNHEWITSIYKRKNDKNCQKCFKKGPKHSVSLL